MSNHSRLHTIIEHNQAFVKKISKIKNIKTIVDVHFFTEMVRYGWFFIISSFLTCFLPIVICLISGSIKITGGEILMGIGLLSSFQIIFTNIGMVLGLTMAITIVKLKIQRENKDIGLHDDYNIIATQFIVNFVVGIVMTFLYIGLSYLYIIYNCNHPNMVLVKEEGLNFIWYTSPSILLNSWLSIFVIIIFRNRGNLVAAIFMLINFSVTLISMCCFAYTSDMRSIGIGLSIDIGLLTTILLIIIWLFIRKEHKNLKYIRMNKKQFNMLLKNSYKVSFESSWRASTRGLVIVILSIISSSANDILPLNMIMAKILWFNMNFFLPYFGTGVSNALKYYTAHKPVDYSYLDVKPFIVFILATIFCNTLTSGVFMACLPEIINSYIGNLDSLEIFAIQNLYDPNILNSNGFVHAYEMWGNLPGPDWVQKYQNIPELNIYLQNNPDGQGLGQLYWVNLTVYGQNNQGDASVMAMFWGNNQWFDQSYRPVFSVTIIFIVLYHISMMAEILLTQITTLFSKKNKSFWVIILMHTAIMGFVLVFAYFTNVYLGIEAFVIPFMLFSLVTLSYTLFKFIKICKFEKKNYYSQLKANNKNYIENKL